MSAYGQLSQAEVFKVLPALGAVLTDEVACRCWQRYGFAPLFDDPAALLPRVRAHLRKLRAAGKVEKTASGAWRRR